MIAIAIFRSDGLISLTDPIKKKFTQSRSSLFKQNTEVTKQ